MTTYGAVTYIDLMKSRVLDESLSMFNQNSVWRIIIYCIMLYQQNEKHTQIGKGLFLWCLLCSVYILFHFILFWSYSISFLFYFIFILLDLMRYRCYGARVHNPVNLPRHRCYSAEVYHPLLNLLSTNVMVQRSLLQVEHIMEQMLEC